MKISIIIPSYNRSNIISKTLDSIKSQSYADWECIVVDDHSSDDTMDVVGFYTRQDSRFKYIVNERKKGAQGARNTGLYKCQTEWVFFFDSDNQMHQDCLKELTSGIKEKVDVVQCFSKVINVETGEVVKYFKWCNYGNIEDKLYKGVTYVDFNHAIIRKSKILEIDGLDEDCPSMQEWDTHMRLSKTATYNTVEKVLVDYFVGAKDAISTDNIKAVKGRLYNLEKFLPEWQHHKIGLFRFVYIYNNLISGMHDKLFREESFKRLDALVVHNKTYAFFGYFINKWFALVKCLSK